MSWVFGIFICMYVFVSVWCKSVKMLLDVCFYKATVFNSSFLKNVYSNRCSDFFPSNSYTFFENRSILKKNICFSRLGGGLRERKSFFTKTQSRHWKLDKTGKQVLTGANQTPTLTRCYFLWWLGWLVSYFAFCLSWPCFRLLFLNDHTIAKSRAVNSPQRSRLFASPTLESLQSWKEQKIPWV